MRTHYYLDGGSIGLKVIDATGVTNLFALPVSYVGDERYYHHFAAGTLWMSRTNQQSLIPLDKSTKQYVCYLIESKSVQNAESVLSLLYLRGAPRDYLSYFKEWLP